ncbi:unnamed protein product [Globisporangium polare]
MKLSSVVLSVAVLACSLLTGQVAAQDKPLPWSGRGQNLTVDTLSSEYLLHILTMRNNGTDGKVSDYVTVDQKGRTPAFNKDTGVITVAVDDKAIFKTQTNFRRSELVQNIAGNADGKTFFRTSVKKDEPFLNEYAWQIIFPESHIFEIRIDASASPAKIIYLNNGTYDAKWETEFKTSTWYNFGIAVSKGAASGSLLEFYTSEGDKPLALAKTHAVVTDFPTDYEFHFGMLTLSSDGSDPVMVKGKQDILSYNGVSVEKGIPSDVVGAAAAGGSGTAAGCKSKLTKN